MKTTIALTCLLLVTAATIPAAEAAQFKTPAVTPHVTISQPKIGSPTGGGGAGKVSINTIHVTKTTDSASPNLFNASTASSGGGGGSGKVTANGFHVTKQTDSASPTLYDTKGSRSGSGGAGDTPTESLNLNFTKVEY